MAFLHTEYTRQNQLYQAPLHWQACTNPSKLLPKNQGKAENQLWAERKGRRAPLLPKYDWRIQSPQKIYNFSTSISTSRSIETRFPLTPCQTTYMSAFKGITQTTLKMERDKFQICEATDNLLTSGSHIPLPIAHALTKLAPPPRVMFLPKLFFTQQYRFDAG